MLAIWSLVPLLFLKPAWTSWSSQFMYCWNLAWRILSITLLHMRWVQLCGSLSIFGIAFVWDWNENWPFPVLWPLLSFPNLLAYWKRLWCWKGLGAGGEGNNRGWDGRMASPTRWTWVWVNPGSWWWTGRPGVLQFMGSQRVGHDWVTELNWLSAALSRHHLLWFEIAPLEFHHFH